MLLMLPPQGQGEHKTAPQNQLDNAYRVIPGTPGIERIDRKGHDQRAECHTDAVAGVQPLHHAGAEVSRHVGVEPGIDRPRPKSSEHPQGDHHPPGRHQGVADQRRAGQGTAERQQLAHPQAGDQPAAEKTGDQVPRGAGDQQHTQRIQRDAKIRPHGWASPTPSRPSGSPRAMNAM